MVTCPSMVSIIGEHTAGRETDEETAWRALREELPGLLPLVSTQRLAITPLRSAGRWFLFDYPPAADGKGRFECVHRTRATLHMPARRHRPHMITKRKAQGAERTARTDAGAWVLVLD